MKLDTISSEDLLKLLEDAEAEAKEIWNTMDDSDKIESLMDLIKMVNKDLIKIVTKIKDQELVTNGIDIQLLYLKNLTDIEKYTS